MSGVDFDRKDAAVLEFVAGNGTRWSELPSNFLLSKTATESRWRKKLKGTDAGRRAIEAYRTGAPTPIPPDHPELRKKERRIQELKAQRTDLKRKLREADADKTVVSQLASVVRESVTSIPYEPGPTIKPTSKQHPVDFTVLLTDEHGDAVVTGPSTWGLERYDYNVFRCRLSVWQELVAEYARKHLPAHFAARLWVFKLGDSIQGDIHQMKHRNHFANSVKAALAVGDAEAQAIAALEPHFPGGVHVVGVSGNHPRNTSRKDYRDPHDNLDYLVSTQIATRLSEYVDEGRVSVHAPQAWSAFVMVRGHLCALNHGDDVRGYAGIPWYGFKKKNNRVQNLVARHDKRVGFFFYGHYHTPITNSEAGAKSIHGGAWHITDDYAINAVTSGNEPEQQITVFNEKHGRLLEIPIYVRDPEREAAMFAGDYEPPFGRRTVVSDVASTDEIAARGEMPIIEAVNAV